MSNREQFWTPCYARGFYFMSEAFQISIRNQQSIMCALGELCLGEILLVYLCDSNAVESSSWCTLLSGSYYILRHMFYSALTCPLMNTWLYQAGLNKSHGAF